jgi:tRNA pseudouridine38-40 synthase
MRNLKLLLAYDGTEFSGWQVQPDTATIQGTLASAIGRVTGEKVLPQGSGRTDAGVHALGQVATFAIQSPIPPENLVTALNDVLPPSIRVLEAAEVQMTSMPKTVGPRPITTPMFRGAICPPFGLACGITLPVGRAMMHQVLALQAARFHRFAVDRSVDGRKKFKRQGNFCSAWHRQDDDLIYTVRGSGFRTMVRVWWNVPAGRQGHAEAVRVAADSRASSRSAAGPPPRQAASAW